MGALLAAIAGGIVWTYLFSFFINSAVSVRTNSDTVKQRLAATILSVFIVISTYAFRGWSLPDELLACGIGGLLTYFAFVKTAPPAAAMIKKKECPKCFEDNYPDSAFCEACGTEFKSGEEKPSPEEMFDKKAISDRVTFICPNCGNQVRPADRICPHCKTPLPADPVEAPGKRPRHFWVTPT